MPSRPTAALPAQRRNAARQRTLQRRRPRVTRLLAWLLATWLGGSGWALAQVAPGTLPSGGQIQVGAGQITQSGKLLVIQQNTNKLGLDWQSFNIGAGATVEFRQPGASSIALNRVLGNSGSEIYGQLKSNGQVFLTNPNGVLFAPGARVDVGGLVASTLDLSQQDFAEGRLNFSARSGGSGTVLNQGSLRASAGGYVALFGQQVANQGEIAVDAGSVLLASGRAATVSISGSGLLSAVVTAGTVPGSVDNSGRIVADGGTVTLTAKSAQDIAASLVNNSGIVRANTLVERGGEIWITGDSVATTGTLQADATGSANAGRIQVLGDMERGTGLVAGTISARSEGGSGGSIETSAAKLRVADGARVDTRSASGRTGHWLIDPTDFTIGSTGALSSSGIGADTLASNLASNSVTLATAAGGSEPGDIHVNADVNWSANTTLTLQAARHINLNASITATGGSAGLVLTPAVSDSTGTFNVAVTAGNAPKVTLSGLNATLMVSGNSYTLIRDLAGLRGLDNTALLGGNYALVADIDASSTSGAGQGFNPIGNETTYNGTAGQYFSGRFDGLGHSISGLTVALPASNYTGLFASTRGATVRNLVLAGGSVAGSQYAGAVVGYADTTSLLHNLRSSASVTATDDNNSGVYAGGLVGRFEGSASGSNGILNSSSSGNVLASTPTGTAFAGGIVGYVTRGQLSGLTAGGTVSTGGTATPGSFFAGGLVGITHSPSNLTGSLATGAVTSTGIAGGLAGAFDGGGAITGSRATGTVIGGATAGGLVGRGTGNISGVNGVFTATGDVSGTGYVGGLVGEALTTGAYTDVSARGNVTGTATNGRVGGLVGSYTTSGSITGARAEGNVSGALDVGGLIGYASGNGALSGGVATGSVSASLNTGSVGGLAGYFNLTGGLSGSDASGNVSGGANTGGLVGYYVTTTALGSSRGLGSTVIGGANYAGGLVGYSNASAISGSSATASVTGGTYAGGLVGRTAGSVTGVAGTTTASGNVSGGSYVGGLVGSAEGTGAFTDVKATGSATGSSTSGRVGGLIGSDTSGGITRATALGAVSGGQYTGGLVGYYVENAAVSTVRAEGNVQGTGDAGGLIGYASSNSTVTDAVALGNVTSSGTGSNVGGLLGFASLTGGLLRGDASGNVAGGNNTGGLVGYMSVGDITNSNAHSSTVSGASYVGGLVGYSPGAGAISGSSASATVTGTYAVGGLVGQSGGAISRSSATGSATAVNYAGGLVGLAYGSGDLSEVQASGAAQASNAGGLVGYFGGSGAIRTGQASGDVMATSTGGGLVGTHGGGTVIDSSASGRVTGISESTLYLGGLIGQYGSNCYFCGTSNYLITNGSASGAVRADAPNAFVGGLIGYMYAGSLTRANTSTTSTVTTVDTVSGSSGGHYAGGLVGYFGPYATDGYIELSNARGAVTGGATSGGLVGYFRGTGITDSSATGDVTGTTLVGGLVGDAIHTAQVRNVSASGRVTADGLNSTVSAGGLYGQLSLQQGGALSGGFASGAVSTAANTSTSYTGGLVGHLLSSGSTAGVVNDSRATGNVSGSVPGNSYTGGLVGRYDNNGQSPLRNSRAEGAVSGGQYAGGLIGGYYRGSSTGTPDDITGSFATGAVSGLNYVGGLVGEFQGAKGISSSYATGSVLGTGSTGATHLGGLVGRYYANSASTSAPATLSTSYATGNVSLAAGATLNTSTAVYGGGLVGYLYGALTVTAIADSYATGTVTLANTRGQLYAGGLLGFDASQNVQRVYATGAVSATGGNARFAGGLVAGRSGGTVSDSYWNTASTGQASSLGGGTGVAGAAMLQAATFGSWSIASTGNAGQTWRIYEGHSNPLLTTFLTPLSLSLANASKTYDGNTSFGNFALTSGGVHVDFPDRVYTTAASADVGSYSIAAAGMYSVQNGYDLSVTGNATLTITPKTITLAGLVADKVYDGTRSATLLGTAQPAGLVAGEDLAVNLSAASALFDTKNAGQDKAVTVSGLTLADGIRGKASNYSLASATTTSASIAKATLNAGGFTATNRAYDGSTTVAVSAAGGTVTGVFGADDVTVDLQSVVNGRVATKDVGTAKAVTVLGASITGADAGNYTLAGLNAVTVDITPRALTVNGLVATNREYDRTVNVDVSTNSAAISGAVGNDVVQLQRTRVTGTVADKNVAYDNTNAVTTKVVSVAGSVLKLRGTDAANYSVQAASTTVTIQPYTLYFAVQTTPQTNRIYDGTANASVTPYTYYSLGGNDDLTLLYNAPTYSDKNVAYNISGAVTSKTITVDGARLTGTDAGNYRLYNTSTTTSGVISPKALTVTGVAAVDRAYDGRLTVEVNVSGATVDTSGIIGNDQVVPTLPSSGTVVGTMLTKIVGQAKPVTVPGFSLSGTDAGNYSLTGNNGVTVNIAQKDLTATYAALDKTYDGNANARVDVRSLDIVAGDTVRFYADQTSCSGSCYSFFVTPTSTPTSYTQSKDAGSNKRVIVAGNPGLYGTDAANYRLLNPTATLSASIARKDITPVFTGVNKVYDGTLAATVNLNANASGVVSGDALSLIRTATFDTKNVGTGKTVTITGIAFTGASAANYTLASDTATTTASITVKTVSVQGVTAVNRAYNGSTDVALVAGNVAAGGVLGNDVVGVTVPGAGLGNGSMADKGIGDNKTVTVSGLTLNGADAGNYVLDGSQGVTVNISKRPLTASYVGLDRVYNAGVEALVTGSSTDMVPGDNLLYTQNAVFTGLGASNVGSNKPIGITGIQLGGTDAGNYALLNSTASTTGRITQKFITVSYSGLGRVYNGLTDTSALVEGSSSDVVAVDRAFVTFSQQARFTGDGAVGTGKAVAVSGITLGGTQGGNYALNATTASTTANVTPRPIGVIGVTATNRVYDGTRTVTVNTSGATTDLSGVLDGDQVSVLLPVGGITTGTVSTKDAGNNKDVTITGLTLSGSSASNYIAAGATGLRVNITPKPLTALYSAASKVYDGNSAATVSASSADILAGDLLNLGITASGVFGAGKNAGTAKTVLVSGGFLTGAERNNYALLNATGSVLADITRKTLQASYQGGTRVYDGGVAAPVSARNLGVIQGDDLGFTQTAVFTGADAKNVGSGKAVAISNIQLTGIDAGNYRLDDGATATTTASITKKPISIDGLTGATATDRVYNATRTVAVTVSTSGSISPSSGDIVPGDQVQINLPAGGLTTGTMLTKDAGRNKPLVVDGLELTGADARNYSVAATSGITVNIAARPLTAVWFGTSRVYDGSTAAQATGQSADLLAGDSLGIVASGLFLGDGAKNVGTGKAMAVFNGSLNGTDAANYTLLNNTGNTTASITPRQVTPGYIGLAKVYDGYDTAQVSSNVSNFVVGDDVSLALTSAIFTAGKNVGNGKAIQVSGITLAGNDRANYALTSTSASTSANITPKPLRIEGLTGVQALDRVYNGSATVDVIVSSSGPVAPNPADLVPGDIVTVNAPSNGSTTGTMADKNVGTAKPVSVAGLSLGGTDAANYSITATSGITVNITPRPLTASYSAGSRVYDGTVLANITGSSADLILGDNIVFIGSGIYTGVDAKNVGNDKAVLVSGGRLSGTDAANYSLLNPNGSATGSITRRPVTVDYAGGSRVYDGYVSAPVTASASGLIGGDLVQVSQTAVFSGPDAKGAGVGKAVQVSGIRLDGIDAVNYALTADSATTTGTITPRPLRVEGYTGVVATDRVYDGTRFVAITVQGTGILAPNLADVVPGDDIGVLPPASGATAGTIADKNVGRNKAVTVAGLTLTGADAHNYLVAAAAGVTVNITPKPYTATYTALDKVYDGTASASISGGSSDLVLGDQLILSASGIFTGAGAKNVGSGKAVAVSGGVLSGTDAANYSLLNSSASLSASITPKQLTASYTGGIRVYDRSTGAPVTVDSSGVIAGDDLQFLQTAEFTGPDARNVGTNKQVLVSGIALQGADRANYALTATTATTTATITPRPLSVSGLSGLQAVDRVYDGSVGVAITGTAVIVSAGVQVLEGDDVQLQLPGGALTSGTMLDKSAGQGKAVALSGLRLSGADAANYQITGTAGLTVNIAPKAVVLLGVSALDRAYDGSTTVAIQSAGGSIQGGLVGDDLSLAASGVTGSMADKHVGSGKAVTVSGLSLSGADAANYTVAGGGLTVNITRRALTATALVADKVYDGQTSASVTLAAGGLVAGDDLRLDGSARYADANAGSGKAVSISGITLSGADAGDYALSGSTLTSSGNITRRALSVTANSLSKMYGETVNLSGTEFSTLGLVAGESIGLVSLASAGTADTAGVAAGPYGIAIGDARGGSFNPANYTLAYTAGTLRVTPRPLTVAGNNVVRYADERNPDSYTYAVSAGGLYGSDRLASVSIPAPEGSTGAPGGSIFELVPGNAVFGSGSASNYALRYVNGLLVVLPKPPRIGEADEGGGGQALAVALTDEQIADIVRAQDTQERNGSQLAPWRRRDLPSVPATPVTAQASAADIALLLAGDGTRITLPTLQKLPLISFDPALRRPQAAEPAAAGR